MFRSDIIWRKNRTENNIILLPKIKKINVHIFQNNVAALICIGKRYIWPAHAIHVYRRPIHLGFPCIFTPRLKQTKKQTVEKISDFGRRWSMVHGHGYPKKKQILTINYQPPTANKNKKQKPPTTNKRKLKPKTTKKLKPPTANKNWNQKLRPQTGRFPQ